MQKKINYLSLFLTYCLPLALITGPAIPDIIIVLISIMFLINSYINKDYSWINLYYSKFFIIFWLSLILISFFSYNKYNSFTDSIIFIRFYLFAIAISYWLINDIKKLKILIFITFLSLIVLVIDAFFQFITYSTEFGYGKSFFGFESFTYGRMTGPFNDEIIGAHISKIFFLCLFLLLYFYNKNIKTNLIILTIYITSFISIFLSGERMALATFLLGIFLFIIFIKERKFLIIFGTIFSVIFILLITIFHKSFNDYEIISSKPCHLCQKIEKKYECDQKIEGCFKIIEMQPDFYTVIKNFDKSIYYSIYSSAINIWKDNFVFGIGINNFEIYCKKNKQYQNMMINYGNCAPHPHNFYIQWLTESGLIGFILFIIFVISLFYNSLKSFHSLSSKISFINLSIIFWPLMSTGSLLKNHHGITTFFVISVCLILSNMKYERKDI